MKALVLAVATVTALGLAGCDKTEDKPQGAAPAQSAAAATELSDDDVPVAEDYLEEATKEIDENNYKAQLDSIDKDIAASKE
jgi:hypothetical protein